jgi:hypothetical protein
MGVIYPVQRQESGLLTCTLSTDDSNGYVRSAPPWMVWDASRQRVEGDSILSATTFAAGTRGGSEE